MNSCPENYSAWMKTASDTEFMPNLWRERAQVQQAARRNPKAEIRRPKEGRSPKSESSVGASVFSLAGRARAFRHLALPGIRDGGRKTKRKTKRRRKRQTRLRLTPAWQGQRQTK